MSAICFVLVLCFLFPAALTAHTQTEACRQFLMRHDGLHQIYAKGEGMRVRVPAVPVGVEGLSAAWHKLQAHALHDPEAMQRLDINVAVNVAQKEQSRAPHVAVRVCQADWCAYGSAEPR